MSIEEDSFYLRCELSYSIQIIVTVDLQDHLQLLISLFILIFVSNFSFNFFIFFIHFPWYSTTSAISQHEILMTCYAPLLTNFLAHLLDTVVSKISAWMVEYLSTLPTQYLNWSHWSIPVLSISSAISFLTCVPIVDNLSENFRQ